MLIGIVVAIIAVLAVTSLIVWAAITGMGSRPLTIAGTARQAERQAANHAKEAERLRQVQLELNRRAEARSKG